MACEYSSSFGPFPWCSEIYFKCRPFAPKRMKIHLTQSWINWRTPCWIQRLFQRTGLSYTVCGESWRSPLVHSRKPRLVYWNHRQRKRESIDVITVDSYLAPGYPHSAYCLLVFPISSNSNFHLGRPTSSLEVSGRYFSSDMLWKRDR